MITVVPMKSLYEQTETADRIFPSCIYLHGELESVCGYDLIDYITCDDKKLIVTETYNTVPWRFLYSKKVQVLPCKVEGWNKEAFICFKTYEEHNRDGKIDYCTRGLVTTKADIPDGIVFANREY